MTNPTSKNQPDGGYERRDISVRSVAGFSAGLMACLVAIFIGIRWMLGIFGEHQVNGGAPSYVLDPAALPPEPRLQADPAADLARFREQENVLLNSYGWIDHKAGVVRIPIEQAMDLIAQRGLPEPPPDSIGKTPLQMRQDKGASAKTPP